MNSSICALALLFASTQIYADTWCTHEAERSANLDVSGARKIVIQTGAGDLKVRGSSTQANVTASGRTCASSDELLQQSQLESRRDGDVLYLKTVLPETNGNFFVFHSYARMDLSVTLPASLNVELEDSSGDVDLENVAAASVNDGSGDLDIRNIARDLKVADSSGDVDIDHVTGNLSVTDSSGDLHLEHIQGSVEIPIDSSGDIRISDVGSVHISSDSSGDIVVQRVKLDVRVDVDSSGDIVAEDVGGNFTVQSDGSGGIHHARISGKVQVPQSKGSED
ncbi:MAG: DUF4097 family beta strand repeat-containing protein [Povalibacter sp.]